jgi:hypothetical protein
MLLKGETPTEAMEEVPTYTVMRVILRTLHTRLRRLHGAHPSVIAHLWRWPRGPYGGETRILNLIYAVVWRSWILCILYIRGRGLCKQPSIKLRWPGSYRHEDKRGGYVGSVHSWEALGVMVTPPCLRGGVFKRARGLLPTILDRTADGIKSDQPRLDKTHNARRNRVKRDGTGAGAGAGAEAEAACCPRCLHILLILACILQYIWYC